MELLRFRCRFQSGEQLLSAEWEKLVVGDNWVGLNSKPRLQVEEHVILTAAAPQSRSQNVTRLFIMVVQSVKVAR